MSLPKIIKAVVIILLSLIGCSTLFSLETPQPLQTAIMEKVNINIPQYEMFYSLYALPNIFMPLFVGIFCNLWGYNLCLVIIFMFTCLGQILFMSGGFKHSFYLMLIGRFMLGLGSESMWLVHKIAISRWFEQKQLSQVFSTISAVSGLGIAITYSYIPFLFNKTKSIGICIIPSVAFLVLGLCCTIMLWLLDYKYDHILNSINDSQTQIISKKCIKLQDLRGLKKLFWLSLFCLFFSYAASLPIQKVSNDFLQKQFKLSYQTAGIYTSLPLYFQLVINPIIGYISDKTRKRILMIKLSGILLIIGYLSFILLPEYGYYQQWSLIGWGIFAIFTGLLYGNCWPTTLIAASRQNLPVALAMTSSILNVSYFVFPSAAGYIYQFSDELLQYPGYSGMLWFLIVISFLLILFGFLLQYEDQKQNNCLQQTKENEIRKELILNPDIF